MVPLMDLPSPPLEYLNLHDIDTTNLSAAVKLHSQDSRNKRTTDACSRLLPSSLLPDPTDQQTHIPSDEHISNNQPCCTTPRDSQDTVLTRIYPSPPLTGSALKQTVPLPRLTHSYPPGMNLALAAHDRDTQRSESEVDTSHDESSTFQPDPSLPPRCARVQTHEQRSQNEEASYDQRHHEPLSPPPTLALGVLELPSEFSSNAHHAQTLPSPVSPQRDQGGSLHSKPHKRLRLIDEHSAQIGATSGGDVHTSDESRSSSLALTPDGTWSRRSRLSDESSTAYSPYDHSEDGHSIQWSSPMNYSSSSSLFHGDDFDDRQLSPSSPRQKLLDLDMPGFDHFGRPFLEEPYVPDSPPGSHPARPPLYSFDDEDDDRHSRHWDSNRESMMDIDDAPHIPPSSPRPRMFHLPISDSDPDTSFADTLMPPEDEDCSSDETPQPHSPMPRQFQPLPDFDSYDESTYLTPVPRSPRGRPALLPLFGDPYEPPPSPSSPHRELPPLPDDEFSSTSSHSPDDQASTSSSSIAAQPSLENESEGLGLFIRSIDPPLARTPSPTEDDFGFLDIQLDPLSCDLAVDEFLALRRMRKEALEFERTARRREGELSEKVLAAATALLPYGSRASSSSGSSSSSSGSPESDVTIPPALDPQLKRLRKHELHMAMDARSEVRKQRKKSKQKSKEIGALLDFKMNKRSLVDLGVDVGKGLRHLVANMVMNRRDSTTRSLSGRKPASAEKKFVKTKLSMDVSVEDLLAQMDIDSDGDEEGESICGDAGMDVDSESV